MIEMLIKVGDSLSWKDGMVIATKPLGQWITATEAIAWSNGHAPELSIDDADYWLALMAQNQADLIDRARERGGFDTNWGYGDLTHHAVVIVDATIDEIRLALESCDTKRLGVLKYWEALSAETVESFRRTTLHVPRRDVAPISFGALWSLL